MKRGPMLWLALVAILLAIILGAVQNGHVQGLRSLSEAFPADFRLNFPLQGATYWSNITITTTISGSVVTIHTVPSGGFGSPPAGFGAIVIPSWYAYVLLAASVLLAFVLLLRGGGRADVHYLPVSAPSLEAEQTPPSAWSSNLRNQAVLRYYSLMSQACSEAGLEESRQETPTEYISRVAVKLRLDSGAASIFASIFNRARYGLELSSQEVKDASEFMEQFVDALERKIGND